MTAARSNPAKRYAKTRSFGKLNGRAVSPGSELPERYYFKRRLMFAAVVLLLLLPGLWALFA